MTQTLLLAILRVLYMVAHEVYDRENYAWTTEYRDMIAGDLATIEMEIERQEDDSD